MYLGDLQNVNVREDFGRAHWKPDVAAYGHWGTTHEAQTRFSPYARISETRDGSGFHSFPLYTTRDDTVRTSAFAQCRA